MHVALVHDLLCGYGEPEKVLRGLKRLYPKAPIYTAFIDRRAFETAAEQVAHWEIRPSFAQALPGVTRWPQFYKGIAPYFWESLDLSEFDLVISSSSGYLSHAVLTRPETLHVCYCHTPARDLWETPQESALQLWRNSRLRQYDFYAAQRVDRFVTNSPRVARRIRKFYRREPEVIAPPVQIQGEGRAGKEYYLYVGELTTRQRVDLAIAACNHLDRPLWVVGSGPALPSLRKLAGAKTRFLEPQRSAAMADLYGGARALIFPCPDVDFASPPIEAMGHGVPVIGSGLHSMKEIVLQYRTGLLFEEPTVEGLCETITKFESQRFSAIACIERAKEFAESVFTAKLEWFIAQALEEHRANPSPGKTKRTEEE